MFFPPLAITQCDVISLAFSLAGIYYLVKKDDMRFIIFGAIAVTMKYLPLFIFIPLFLYRYKKAKQFAFVGIAGASLLLVSILLMSLSSVARQAVSNPAFFDVTAQIREFFEGSTLELGLGNMSIVSAYFIAVCILAHFIEPKEETQYRAWIPWIALAGWYTLFIFWGANTYWYVLIAPFIILVILNRTEHLSFGLMTEIVLMNVMMMERICSQWWVFGGGATFTSLMLRDYVSSHSALLYNILNRLTGNYFSALKSVYISAIVVLGFTLLICFRPTKATGSKDFPVRPLKVALWIQLAILFLWCGLALAEEIRLTNGIEYGVEDVSFSDGVVVEDGEAVLKTGDTQEFPYIALPAGGYRLTIYADNLTVDIQYYYNEILPINYTVVDEGDGYMQVEFTLDTYLETVQFLVTNRTSDEIIFYSYRLYELK
jgi:hypothetical protein